MQDACIFVHRVGPGFRSTPAISRRMTTNAIFLDLVVFCRKKYRLDLEHKQLSGRSNKSALEEQFAFINGQETCLASLVTLWKLICDRRKLSSTAVGSGTVGSALEVSIPERISAQATSRASMVTIGKRTFMVSPTIANCSNLQTVCSK